jgi:hypothetical protein
VNQSLCGSDSAVRFDVTGCFGSLLDSEALWISVDIFADPGLIGSPTLDVRVLASNSTILHRIQSQTRWRSNGVMVSRAMLRAATRIDITVSRQSWLEYYYTPQAAIPTLEVTSRAAAMPQNATGPCVSQAVSSNEVLSDVVLCPDGITTLTVTPSPYSSLPNPAAGYDLMAWVNVTSSPFATLDEIELDCEALVPALVPFYNGTGFQKLRYFGQIAIPSKALDPSLIPTVALLVQFRLLNRHGYPIRVSVGFRTVGCSDDGYANGPVELALNQIPLLSRNPATSKLATSFSPLPWVCRTGVDYWKLPVEDAEVIDIDIVFESFGGRVKPSGEMDFSAMNIGIEVLTAGQTPLGGDNTLEGVSYRGRVFTFFTASVPAGDTFVFLKVTTDSGSSKATYALDATWRNFSTMVGGSPVLEVSSFTLATTGATGGASGTTGTITAQLTASATTIASLSSPSPSSASGGATVGIVLGILIPLLLVVIVVVIVVVIWLRRRNDNRSDMLESVDNQEYGVMGTFAASSPETNAYEMQSPTLHLSGARTLEGVQLEVKIGEGNYGSVWRAMWQGTPVAAKTVENISEIEAELSILLKIDHPNCIHFLGNATVRHCPFLYLTFLLFEIATHENSHVALSFFSAVFFSVHPSLGTSEQKLHDI